MKKLVLNYGKMKKIEAMQKQGFTQGTIAGAFEVTVKNLKGAIEEYKNRAIEREEKRAARPRKKFDRRPDNFIPVAKEDRHSKVADTFGSEREISKSPIRKKSEQFIKILRKFHAEREVKK